MKIRLTIAALLLLTPPAVFAQVVIKTYGQHVGGAIVYTHEVSNTGTRGIVAFDIGHDTDFIGTSSGIPYTRGIGELNVFPAGSLDSDRILVRPEVPSSLFSGPTGWTARIEAYGHGGGAYLEWQGPPHPLPLIEAGQTAIFRITVPEFSTVYLTGHFSVRYVPTHETKIWGYNGVMTKLDTAPPTLSLSLTPSTMRAGSKLLSVAAAITVTDNYDPASEIKLESVTANQTLKSGDISGATFGTDDRAFKLKPVTGRVYTVTYSATDGTGNKAIASATVTVSR